MKSCLNSDVDLKSYSSVRYGEVHGVTYTTDDKEETWDPVVGRRSKTPKRSVPLHAPPCQVKQNLQSSDESTSDESALLLGC